MSTLGNLWGRLFGRRDPRLQQLLAAAKDAQLELLRARYDLAQTTVHNSNHYAAADSYSARSSLSPAVRKKMRERSRLEAENSSWYAGILSTVVNHIVGTGPRLQVQTGDPDANARLECAFAAWMKSVDFTSKLRVAVKSDWRDGESFLMRARRPQLGEISLDVKVYETEQCCDPFTGGSWNDPFQDDGIRLDPDSNEIEYWFLDHHPSDPFYRSMWSGRWYKSRFVLHLYQKDRAGQLRGAPRFASGLPLLAVMRRFEMATVHAAESVANVALYMKTTGASIEAAAGGKPFSIAPTARNALMQLPEGWDLFQPKMENPNSNLEMFVRQMMMAFCRAGNVPLGLGIGTSKDSNFSSFKGDIRNLWAPEVATQRERIETTILEPVFSWFLEEAIYVPGLLDGMPPFLQIPRQWFWDQLPPLDEFDAAAAAEKRIQSGQSTLPQEYADRGFDFDTAMARGASGFGVSVEAYKTAIFNQLFGIAAGTPSPGAAPANVPAQAAGAYTELGQRAFRNNMRRITEWLEEVARGDREPANAAIMMQMIGVDQSHIDALLADVADGQLDDPELAGRAA